jgi:hypothetical protein
VVNDTVPSFDAPGVELGHHEGRCSFESIIQKYELKEPGLLRLAQIVHGADVAEDIDKDPLARGLEAIASGFSLRYPEDEENLPYQFEVYDALYAWCRLQVLRDNNHLIFPYTKAEHHASIITNPKSEWTQTTSLHSLGASSTIFSPDC